MAAESKSTRTEKKTASKTAPKQSKKTRKTGTGTTTAKTQSKTRGRGRKPAARKSAGKKKQAGPSVTVTINPATLEKNEPVENTDLKQMPDIFSKARAAQKVWAACSFRKRAAHIKKMRRYIVENAEELAEIVSRDNGKSRIDALATEVIPCALASDWYAKNARASLRPQKLPVSNLLFANKRSMITRVPLGVVGIISPWNYPLSIPFGEVVMALMAGNAVVLKVAAATIRVGRAIEKIVEAGELPAGLFTHVVGSGSQISKSFFENRVDKIFFTGSVPTGKVLMKGASDTLTPLSLELGGKDPMIVLPDADLERAANGAAWAGYQNAGQSCGGVERVYVHEKVYDKFIDLLAEKTRRIRHGFDSDFNKEMGSLTTEEQKKTVEKHVKDAVKNGAEIIAQSEQVDDSKGYFYPATLMTGVDHSMTIMREETFGPVIPVMKFSDIEEALELANDSTMALTSSVWTKDIELGRELAKRLESGVTTINDHLYTHGLSETPWGGWKESGIGRTHSALGLHEMTQPKLINWDLLPVKRDIWWFPFNRETYDSLLSALRFTFPANPLQLISEGTKVTVFALKKMFSRWK